MSCVSVDISHSHDVPAGSHFTLVELSPAVDTRSTDAGGRVKSGTPRFNLRRRTRERYSARSLAWRLATRARSVATLISSRMSA
jgi:hypothetical protein